MNNISIVTAFFDIGRGDWTPDKGLPHYLERKTETYLERFGYLTNLKNDITVFTTEDLAPKVQEICKNRTEKTNVVILDLNERFSKIREDISNIQKDPKFQSRVHPSQVKNPEYWNPDYVLVTNLKAFFVDVAIQNNFVQQDMVAWIDFGYCRSMANIPKSREWSYDFDESKIHMFNYKPYDGKPIERVVLENDVYILGAKVVAHKNKWPLMAQLMGNSHQMLKQKGLVDDDQGLWLQSYISQPQEFELHIIPDHQYGHDPFVLFNQYNKEV
jgi:protein YibB